MTFVSAPYLLVLCFLFRYFMPEGGKKPGKYLKQKFLFLELAFVNCLEDERHLFVYLFVIYLFFERHLNVSF